MATSSSDAATEEVAIKRDEDDDELATGAEFAAAATGTSPSRATARAT